MKNKMKKNRMNSLAKKLMVCVVAICCLSCTMLFTACNDTSKTIGIIQFGNHPSLNNCYQGIVTGLKEGGIDLDKEYKIDLQISNFDPSTSAAQANLFANKNVSLIGAIATPSAMAAASAVNGAIPVVFCAVSDPVAAGLTGYENVAGSQDVLDFAGQLQLIRAFMPDATKIGVLYSTKEDNSLSQIQTLIATAPTYGFTIEAESITETNEINTKLDLLISKGIDCMTNLTDNTVVGALSSILEKTNAAGIPVFGSEIEQVKNGCLASASLDYVELGRLTGLYMAKVLKGEETIEKGDFFSVENSFKCFNSEVAQELNITVPTSITIEDVIAVEE